MLHEAGDDGKANECCGCDVAACLLSRPPQGRYLQLDRGIVAAPPNVHQEILRAISAVQAAPKAGDLQPSPLSSAEDA